MPTFDTPLSGVSHSQALKQAWVLADTTVTVLETLTFAMTPQPFLDENGNPTEAYVVRDFAPLTATLEADAPMHAGQPVTFLPVAFDMDLPSEQEGGVPQIALKVDNVSRQIYDLLKQLNGTLNKVTLTHRTYLTSDLSGPHTLPVTKFTLQEVSVLVDHVEAKAGLGDIHNTRFPADVHDVVRFPGLTAR
jgi:hypothetical protein